MSVEAAAGEVQEGYLLVRLPGPAAVEELKACRNRGLEAKTAAFSKSRTEGNREISEAIDKLKTYDGGLEVNIATLRAAFTVTKELAGSQEGSGESLWKRVIHGCKPVFPQFKRRVADIQARQALTAEWRRDLHARAEKRQYDDMVKNVHWGGPQSAPVETKPLYQASIGFNMIAAAATAGFIGYYVSGGFLSSDAHKLVVGTICAVVMLVVELLLYIIRTSEIDRYAEKRQRNAEMGMKGGIIPGSVEPSFRVTSRPGLEKLKHQ